MCNNYKSWENGAFDVDLSVYEDVIKSQVDRLKNKKMLEEAVCVFVVDLHDMVSLYYESINFENFI
jgi:hypothetical protein